MCLLWLCTQLYVIATQYLVMFLVKENKKSVYDIECTGFCNLEVVQKHTLCAMYYVLFVLWRRKSSFCCVSLYYFVIVLIHCKYRPRSV